MHVTESDVFSKFKAAMITRYAKSDEGNEFYIISQATGEHELDLLARLKRAWLRMKKTNTFTTADERVIYGRFISALNDPVIRLKIREHEPTFQNLA